MNTPIDEQIIDIYLVVGNASSVSVVTDGSIMYVTMLNMTEHNESENAHAEAIEKHNTSAIAHADLLHIWQHTKAYIKGDICFPAGSSYPSWMILECTAAGTSAATEPNWGSIAGAEITDNTAKWSVKNLISGSGVSIGTVMPHLATTAPAGWLACDTGALVSRTTYSELWAWVQAKAPLITEAAWQAQAAVQSSVGYYSSGDGSTTFRLPRLVDFVRGSDGVRLPGTWQDDEFKSHSHDFGGVTGSTSGTTGVYKSFVLDETTPTATSSSAAGSFYKFWTGCFEFHNRQLNYRLLFWVS